MHKYIVTYKIVDGADNVKVDPYEAASWANTEDEATQQVVDRLTVYSGETLVIESTTRATNAW